MCTNQYKFQNHNVQCKQKLPNIYFDAIQNFKNALANTTYQELTNYGPWAKSGLPSVYYINKVLLEQSYCHSFTHCPWKELSSYDREFMAHRAKIFIIWLFK